MVIFRSETPKPLFGSDCNGCGYCCSVQPCAIAQEFLGAKAVGACPAIEVTPERTIRCGLITQPLTYLLARLKPDWPGQPSSSAAYQQQEEELARSVAEALGAGKGCDADDDEQSNAWPWPVELQSISPHQ